MADFSNILSSLHGGQGASYADSDAPAQKITITKKRTFLVPNDFDTVVAYEGDVHTQIITFVLPASHEEHPLSECDVKELRWKHLSSNIEGISDLTLGTVDSEAGTFEVLWEIPPEACVAAGGLEIALRIRDSHEGEQGFVWNTASYSGLSVGKSMTSVSADFPPKDEILMIDRETKNIIAPQGYDNTICVCGDVGTANVYFLVNRYLGGNNPIDLLNEETKAKVYVIMNGWKKKQQLTIRPYTAGIVGTDKDGLVLLSWQVSSEFTVGLGPGNLEISIEFTVEGPTGKEGKPTIAKRWFSNSYKLLNVASSILQIKVVPDGPPMTDEEGFAWIEEFYEVYDVVFDANLP